MHTLTLNYAIWFRAVTQFQSKTIYCELAVFSEQLWCIWTINWVREPENSAPRHTSNATCCQTGTLGFK